MPIHVTGHSSFLTLKSHLARIFITIHSERPTTKDESMVPYHKQLISSLRLKTKRASRFLSFLVKVVHYNVLHLVTDSFAGNIKVQIFCNDAIFHKTIMLCAN